MRKYLLGISSAAFVSFWFGLFCSVSEVTWLSNLVKFPVEEVIVLSFLTSVMLGYILVELRFVPVDYLLSVKFQNRTSNLDFLETAKANRGYEENKNLRTPLAVKNSLSKVVESKRPTPNQIVGEISEAPNSKPDAESTTPKEAQI